jgi:hypothetical protein
MGVTVCTIEHLNPHFVFPAYPQARFSCDSKYLFLIFMEEKGLHLKSESSETSFQHENGKRILMVPLTLTEKKYVWANPNYFIFSNRF